MRHMPKATLDTIYFLGISSTVIYGILIWGSCYLQVWRRFTYKQQGSFIIYKKVTNVFVLKSTLISKGKIIFIVFFNLKLFLYISIL